MLTYTFRRLMFTIPVLLFISFIIFLLLDMAPNDPTGNLPMTIPPEVREKIRESLGLGQPIHVRYFKWCVQFFVNEPINIIEQMNTNAPTPDRTHQPQFEVDHGGRVRTLSLEEHLAEGAVDVQQHEQQREQQRRRHGDGPGELVTLLRCRAAASFL